MHNRQIDIHTYFSIINAIDLISFPISQYLKGFDSGRIISYPKAKFITQEVGKEKL